MSHTFEYSALNGMVIKRSKESFAGYKAASAAMTAHRNANRDTSDYKVVRVGYVKPAPEPVLVVQGNIYGWRCEDHELLIFGNSAAEAIELWAIAYKQERDME